MSSSRQQPYAAFRGNTTTHKGVYHFNSTYLFADKRRSLGRYSSLADSDYGVQFSSTVHNYTVLISDNAIKISEKKLIVNCIPKVPRSNLNRVTSYTHWVLSWFTYSSPREFWDCYPHTIRLFPNAFPIINHHQHANETSMRIVTKIKPLLHSYCFRRQNCLT
jgi:hypothetical protein